MTHRRTFLASVAAFTAAVLAPSAQAQTSPPAETTAAIGGKKVQIKYSSPRMRGRKIMGGLVPFNQIWRTGADSATTLSTEANLQIGSLKVPKGNYTIFTIPTANEWTLVINKELGQWGLDYHEKLDFGRAKMTVKALPAAVENFAIAVKSTGGNNGILTMTWEKTEASVPITLVP
ncbi:MAG: DUF2911 domain-containing protein [Bryobacteraceae bacterium]